jgi:replicative DNA helicase
VSTGFPSVDTLLGGGFRRGDLAVLGGDVGSGKSALAMAFALRAASHGASVGYLSSEMTVERLTERALAIEGRATVDQLRGGTLTDESHASVAAAALRLRERSPIFAHLADTGVAGVSDFTVEHLGLELLVIDCLQSLATGASPLLDEELARATRELKELAIRRGSAILLISHLATPPRGRADQRPRLEDFGALGTIRQHPDVLLAIYREEVYAPSRDIEGASELHVLKNRNGAVGYIDLYFYGRWLRFEDMVEPDR